jgi:hypothetical protein
VPNITNAPHESFAETGDLAVSNLEHNQGFGISDASHVDSSATEDPITNPRVDSGPTEVTEATLDPACIGSGPVSVPVSMNAHGSASDVAPEGSFVPAAVVDGNLTESV